MKQVYLQEIYTGMYSKYSESKGWKVNLVDFNEGTSGGYKEISF